MEELNCETAFTIPVFGGIPVAESVVVTWIIMAVLLLGSIILVRNLKLFSCPRRESSISRAFNQCQALVRFFALRRIKPHTPPLVRAPVNSFEFQPCGRTPQAGYLLR